MNQPSPQETDPIQGQPLTSWKPGQAIPRPDVVMFEEFENYLETVPERLEIADVELIWWTAAACLSYDALRDGLAPLVATHFDPAGFLFSPIADLEGNGRYPAAIIELLREILPEGGLVAVYPDAHSGAEDHSEVAGSLIIQDQIWHELTWKALALVPVGAFPDRLRDLRFSSDLGN